MCGAALGFASLVLQKARGLTSEDWCTYLLISLRYFDDFERQLLAPGLGTFSQYVVPDTLVDWFLANELIKSANDGYRGSVYFWKDANNACECFSSTPAA